jgi:hypothetical protein
MNGTPENPSYPEKIPDELIIKHLQQELGVKESYIQELEHTISKLNTDQDREIRKEIKSEEIFKNLKQQLSKSKKENTTLRKSISELVIRISALKS